MWDVVSIFSAKKQINIFAKCRIVPLNWVVWMLGMLCSASFVDLSPQLFWTRAFLTNLPSLIFACPRWHAVWRTNRKPQVCRYSYAPPCLTAFVFRMSLTMLLAHWQLDASVFPLQLGGCGILGVGVWLSVTQGNFATLSSSLPSLSAANLLIAVGTIIMVIGCLGCVGAVKESRPLLLTVSYLPGWYHWL